MCSNIYSDPKPQYGSFVKKWSGIVVFFMCIFYNFYAGSQNRVFFKTKKVVGFSKMDKNICPKTDFAK